MFHLLFIRKKYKKQLAKMKSISVGVLIIFTVVTIEGSSLCDRKNKSCTDQLWTNGSEPAEMCHMTYYKLNSAECAALNFQYKTDTHELGDVRLIAYVNEDYRQTVFSVIFSNILWKKVIMRFAKMETENERNMCRMFNIWENVTVPKSAALTYDCPWSHADYEGEDYAFEYEFGLPNAEYKKIVFKVPVFKNFNGLTKLKSLEIFSYIDVTDSEYLQLHIQNPPPKYNITSYLVEVIRERSNTSTRLTVQILDAKHGVNGQLIFLYPTWNEFGYFYFNISPISDACKENECLKSSTPKYLVGRKKSSLVIGIVGASVILFALFYAMFFWNRKKNNKETIPPRVLLVYNSSVDSHCHVVRNLAILLQDLLRIEVLLDVLDIPQTNHQDPLLWCNHAFIYASHIIYIASPEMSVPRAKTDNIYKIYGAALKFIRRELVRTQSSKQMLVITFPYSINAVPPELTNLRRFNLMKDMDTFISALVTPPYQSWTFLQIFRPNILRSEPQYMDFLTSIHTAQKEIEILSECVTSSNSQTPKITVTENSVDSLAAADDTSEDEEMLLKLEENFSFHISDLNLSGNNEEHQPTVHRPAATPINDFRINLQDLPL